MTENKNRVCCLYRVSTDKQVDFNSNHEADLPMQRKACHKLPKQRAGSSSMKNKKKACLATKSAQKPVTSCKSSRNTPERQV